VANVTAFNPKNATIIATKPVFTYELWILNVSSTAIDSFFAGNLSVNFNTSKLTVNCSIEFPTVNYIPPAEVSVNATSGILGCSNSTNSTCLQCNEYSKLSADNKTCDCAFRYNVTLDKEMNAIYVNHF
jgi:hypothetical protein